MLKPSAAAHTLRDVVTKSVRWRRWGGYRNTSSAAAGLAQAELAAWHGVDASVRLDMDFADGLSERSDELAPLDGLSNRALHQLRAVTIFIEADRTAWSEAHKPDYVPHPDGHVRIRLWSVSGLEVQIEGERRAQVEGLATQMSDVLAPGAPPFHSFDVRLALGGVAVVLLWIGVLLETAFLSGSVLVSQENHVIDRWEGTGIALGVLLAGLITWLLYYVTPTVEVLDQGGYPAIAGFEVAS